MENQTDVTTDTGTAPGRLRIFLNYRRTDTEDAAGRLFDALCSHFGEHHVFMDIDDIEPGVDFDQVVHEAVGQCDVLLAVIGPQWLTMVDGQGRRRLDKPDDYVRIELQVALERNIRLVPVLIHDVAMPLEEELPESLRRLAHKQAVGLSTTRWKYDLGKLIEALESVHRERPYSSEVLQAVQAGQAAEPATTPAQPTTAQAAEPTTAPAVPITPPAQPTTAQVVEPTVAPPHAAPPPPPKPVRRGRRRLLWGAGGIVAVVAIIAIIAAASGGGTLNCSGTSPDVSTPSATINFVNSAKVQAWVYWLTYSGARQLYFIVAPGGHMSQATYEDDKWVIFKSGTCSAMTVAKAGSQTFVIH